MSNNPNPMQEVQINKPQTQKVVFKEEAHKKLLSGAETLAKAVASTMGPSGHSVIIDNVTGSPLITKDGVTVARSIHLKDKLESVGAELLKEIASKTNDLAGDGPQPLYAKVLTPNGWTTMKNVRPGDLICGTNGTVQKVLGVYPKGKRAVYKVITLDGRTVECCKDHLWSVKTRHGNTTTLTTKQLIEKGLYEVDANGKNHVRFYLPNSPVKFTDKTELPVDPYLAGFLFGSARRFKKTKKEIELFVDSQKKHALDSQLIKQNRVTIINEKQGTIIKIKLPNEELSSTKYVPQCFLRSSLANRKEFLKGLLATVHDSDVKGPFKFTTTNKSLFDDFIELCRSLGRIIYTRITSKRSNSKKSRRVETVYEAIEPKNFKHGIGIKKIIATGKKTEMCCIKVSNPDKLYITNDYVVTHNTTTATVLGYASLYEGIKQITAGCSSIHLKKGMEIAKDEVIKFLKENCVPVGDTSDIVNVGTISANGDREIGLLISKAIEKVGRDGIITIEPAKSVHTQLDIVEGMQLENGYVSPFFITNSEKSTCELEDPYILMTSNRISSLTDLIRVLEQIARTEKPLLIIADEIEGDALHTLIVNKMKGVLKVCAVKAPSYGEHRADILSDLSIVVGGEVFGATNETSLKNATIEQLGRAKKVIVGRKSCVIVGDPGDNERRELIQKRIESLRNALTNDNTLDDLRISKYRERLAKLSGGIAVLKIGGSTEVEILEKKDRVEDAVNATLAAAQEGIVPGGGVALFYASQALRTLLQLGKFANYHEDTIAGIKLVANVCEYPLHTIVKNTGRPAEVVKNELAKQYKLNPNFKTGYNAAQDKFANLIEEGIIDPVKVTRYALEHAISVVGLMLTCNAVIVNEDNE